MTYNDAVERAERYAAERSILVDYERRLGVGQEGFVWKTNRDSAIKVFDRSENFARERACYEILQQRKIFTIRGFTVPEFLDCDERLRVLEMSIVSPPYILDFGKAWVNQSPDFPEESRQEHQLQMEELFGESWGAVRSALSMLKSLGIHYLDARPGNINCEGHAER